MLTANPPESLLRAMYATLTDRYYGLASLGLASLREKASHTTELLCKLPDIDGVAARMRRSSPSCASGSRNGARRRAASGSRP